MSVSWPDSGPKSNQVLRRMSCFINPKEWHLNSLNIKQKFKLTKFSTDILWKSYLYWKKIKVPHSIGPPQIFKKSFFWATQNFVTVVSMSEDGKHLRGPLGSVPGRLHSRKDSFFDPKRDKMSKNDHHVFNFPGQTSEGIFLIFLPDIINLWRDFSNFFEVC